MAFGPQKNERINDLERDLYSRDAELIKTTARPELTPHEKHVEYGWKEEKPLTEELAEIQETDEKKGSFVTKIFMASVLFFVVAAGIAGYVILGGFNVISSKNVDISVRGLVAASAGEEMSLDIIVQNKNNTAIEKGTIFVEYPEGTRKAGDVTQELPRDQIDFESVASGDSISKTVKAVLFGQKDSVQQIKIRAEYQARGSNAVFTKEKTYDVTIKSSPVVMTVEMPNEVNTGQEIEIGLELASNANSMIGNMLVRAEYPFGFTFTSATPEPAFDNNVWNIGDLDPKEKRSIKIRGRMVGQNEEERTFRFMTGTASGADEKMLAINYLTLQEPVFIRKAFIGLDLKLNGNSENTVVTANDSVQTTLTWTNNLPVTINNAVVQVKLSGTGLDAGEVQTLNGGFYRSSDNTITWDKNSVASLRSIEPGERGTVSFSMGVLPSSAQLISRNRNMDLVVDAKVSGTRIQDGASQDVVSTVSGTAKVRTDLGLTARALRSIGAFRNTGPIPPRVNQETTYTIVVGISNTYNDLSNITFQTKLPPYVRWLDKATDIVQYDESSRTVTWSIPSLRSGVGHTSPSKELSFQVGLTPSSNQENTSVNLTGDLEVTGADRFTGVMVGSSRGSLSTRTDSDPNFRNGDERVVR